MVWAVLLVATHNHVGITNRLHFVHAMCVAQCVKACEQCIQEHDNEACGHLGCHVCESNDVAKQDGNLRATGQLQAGVQLDAGAHTAAAQPT